jgi:hypothetical protein
MNQIAITQSACGGKTVFVTEAGYPHAGLTNGGNVPSYANQGIALTSLFEASYGYVTFFTYTDGISHTVTWLIQICGSRLARMVLSSRGGLLVVR